MTGMKNMSAQIQAKIYRGNREQERWRDTMVYSGSFLSQKPTSTLEDKSISSSS